jgi:hypothetical protein
VTGRAVAAVTLCGLVGRAAADDRKAPPAAAEPDPAVEVASEGNLESTEHRQGLTFAAALGGGMTIGFGVKDSVGRGGSVDLRLGHVVGPRWVTTLEADITIALHRRGSMDPVSANTQTALLAGMQYYVSQSLWVRGAGGAAIYDGRKVALSDGRIGDLQLIGPAGQFGAGIDLARFKSVVLGADASASVTITSQGVLFASGLRVGLAFD